MRLGTEERTTTVSTFPSTSSPVFTQEEKYPLPQITQPSGYPAKSGAKFTAARKLQALRQHVLEDPEISAELAYYVPPNGQSSALSTQSDPLQPWIEKEFLHNDARVLLLKAPGGAGKSTFNRHLLRQLWQDSAWAEWKPGEVPPPASVPIFIPLGLSQVNPKRLLTYLSHLPEPLESFTDEELNVLKEDYQLLLIADGYDEIPDGSKLNLYDANSLGKYQGRVKLLVSSRDFIGRESVESSQLVPHGSDTGRAEYGYYRERWVSSFSESQIADYLERYLAKNKDRTDIILWSDVATYQEHFKALPELKPLISAPFLLWIAAEALPSIVQGVELELKETAEKEHKYEDKSREKEPDIETKSSSHPERKIEIKDELKDSKVTPVALQKTRKEITRLRLYAQFMEQWFHRQAEKAVLSKDLLENPEVLLGDEGLIAVQMATGANGDLLAAEYLKQAYRQFCQLFANHLQAAHRTSMRYPAESKRRGRFEESSSRDPIEESKEPTQLPWASELFGLSSKDWQRVRQGCPLRSAGNEHQFLHASLIDYFVATIPVEQINSVSEEKTAVLDEKNQEQLLTSTSLIPPEPILSSPGESFITLKTHPDTEMIPLSSGPPPSELVKNKRRGGRLAAPVDPATQRLLDPKTIGFRVDELRDQPGKSQHYWDLIERSKTDQHMAIASANAATVLNTSGANLCRRDWQGVRIPGANLRLGNLAYMNLSGADLTGANLTRTWLYGANLEAATLTGVEWGELPWLECREIVVAVAFHPREPWLAIAQGKTIEIRHQETGEPEGSPFTGHEDNVTDISFSRDGQMLVSGSRDKTVRLWKVATRKPLGETLSGHKEEIDSVSFSPDGQLVASGDKDGTLLMWQVSVADGKQEGLPFIGHQGPVHGLTFSPNGQFLASAGGYQDNTVRLWQVATREPLGAPITGHQGTVHCVSFSPDSQLLASGGIDETVRLWKVMTQKPVGKPLKGHRASIQDVLFSPDGQLLASGSTDNTVRLWQVATREALGAPLTGHQGTACKLSFSPNGRVLASGSTDKTVRLWQIATEGWLGAPLIGHQGPVYGVSFSPDGQLLASGGKDKTVQLWQVATGEPLCAPLIGHNGPVYSVSFNPDGQLLASGGGEWDKDEIRFWSVDRREPLGAPLTGGDHGPVHSIAFSRNGQILATCGEGPRVRLWAVSTREPLRQPLTLHDPYSFGVKSVSFSPDGKLLASGGRDKTAQLWQVDTQKQLPLPYPVRKGRTVTLHQGHVDSVSFSPNNKLLASGSEDGRILLWSIEIWLVESANPQGFLLAKEGTLSENLKRVLAGAFHGHTRKVHSVSFSPDGQALASASEDKTVRLWSVASRRCLAVFTWSAAILSITFQPMIRRIKQDDDHLLAMGDADGTVSFWLLSAELFRNNEQAEIKTDHRDEKGQSLTPSKWRLLGSSRCSAMQLWTQGVQLSGCRMSMLSKRLLQQTGADVSKIEIIEKSLQESKYETSPLKLMDSESIPTSSMLTSASTSSSSSTTITTELQQYNPDTSSSSTSASSLGSQSSLVAQSSFQGSRIARLKAQLNLPTEQIGFNSSSTPRTLGNSSTQN